MSKFQEDLCGCFSDFGVCLFGCCVPCGIICLQAKAVSLVTNDGVVIPYLLASCCFLIGNALNRGTIRTRIGIYGSFIGDCCTWCYCAPCAGCQEYREARLRISSTPNVSLGITYK